MYENIICFSCQRLIQKQSTTMECFRFGFNFPSIQNKATTVSRKVLNLPRRTPKRYRYRVKRPIKIETPKIPLKIYNPPPTFSIELHNMFEILDI